MNLPERIARLDELAHDLWWTWHDARAVFRRLDYRLWRLAAHNPVRVLRMLSAERLREVARDPDFLAAYDAAMEALDSACRATDTWWARHATGAAPHSIAYFSAEFALHQSLPIYAGGLGVLAGDICKEASDLGLPLVAVGFMYPQGYFHQRISAEGWQEELYETLDWAAAPIEPALGPDGLPCVVQVPVGQRAVRVAVWRVRVGRVSVFLLDTQVDANALADRELSARLYGGGTEMRVQQEVILGVGGVRALRALGVTPGVWHMNEGHAGFVALERLREELERGLSFGEALEEIRRTTVFTTHTPVAAGHDAFPVPLVEAYLAGCWGDLDGRRDAFLALGLYDTGAGPLFNMTALAMRVSGSVNAVSRRHREVTSRMWAPLWPDLPGRDCPVRAVTNGVHVPTWIAPDMAALFSRHLGPDWLARHDDQEFWEGILAIPDEEIWDVRRALRGYLFTFIRERARQRWTQGLVSAARVVASGTLLDPSVLTIGFARRFTAYKRPELIFRDPERLGRILNSQQRPVQIVFAGKAHPADEPGKRLLQRVYHFAVNPLFGGRVSIVDDYDLHAAHFLVQGCDVWLNNPREPLEASGTSGMKAAINGVPHLSIGDGWWAEGYTGSNGWLIDGRVESDDSALMDAADADALYRLIESEVVPAFYERDPNDIPRRWVRLVKDAIRTVTPRFSARRMVKQYVREMYDLTGRPVGARLAADIEAG